MIRLPDIPLPEEARSALARLQEAVNAHPTYEAQVEAGKSEFKNARQRNEFKPVLKALTEMSSGARRCHYCEDSAATDVEHIHPQDFYPHKVFDWDNYLYACPRCNRPKSNKFDIHAHATGERLSVPKHVADTKTPPPLGDPLLINPRTEDPMTFLMLDIRETFELVAIATDARERERATYTKDLLKLNEQDVLPDARKEAYDSYVARLEKYIRDKAEGVSPEDLARQKAALNGMGHPTVWREIKRQQARIPALRELFEKAPEALDW